MTRFGQGPVGNTAAGPRVCKGSVNSGPRQES
ncbi:hypothetical protein SGPA1_10271 [Streptomyces misionensis JCM 4497]